MTANTLYYGDNLDVLRRHIKDESVDLVYLDPPFNSNATYNVLFEEKDGHQAAAQIKAFEDTWHWDKGAAAIYDDTVRAGGSVADVLVAFQRFLGDNDMLAYLAMMAPRLVELRRVMKPTASIYLHCDPTAGAHLRLLMDAVFGQKYFRNEIVWRRTNARSTAGAFPKMHDLILFYSKSDDFHFAQQKVAADKAKMPHTLITVDGLKYQTYELTAPGLTKDGDSGKAWRGHDPARWGRHWANNHETMNAWDAHGLIHWAKDGFPRRRDSEPFDPESRVVTVGDVWTDIDRINQAAKEKLGYPTQKPVALLERIISASSNVGDIVLDPFCGCGTAVDAAEKLGRRWIGIDITHIAIGLIKTRLSSAYTEAIKERYRTIGEPTTVEDAAKLADEDKYQFQAWALGLVDARRSATVKKGADRGIDGQLYFNDGSKASRQIIFSVKGGHLKMTDVHSLAGVVADQKADIGVLISFEQPTKPMRSWAASQGFYVSEHWGRFPRIQLLTIADLLAGKSVERPMVTGSNVTHKQAPRVLKKVAEQRDAFGAKDE